MKNRGNHKSETVEKFPYIKNILPSSIEVEKNIMVKINDDGTVTCIGGNEDTRKKVEKWQDIIAIAGGEEFIIGLKSDGTVVAAGSNEYGQCDISSWKEIMDVSASDYHSVGLKADGIVLATGLNKQGQCEVDSWRDVVKILAGNYYTAGLKSDETVYVSTNELKTDKTLNVVKLREILKKQNENNSFTCLRAVSFETKVQRIKEYAEKNVQQQFAEIVSIMNPLTMSIRIENNQLICDKKDGNRPHCINIQDDESFKSRFIGQRDFITLSAGWAHVVGLRRDGTVTADGSNNHNQCNVSDWQYIIDIAAGRDHSIGLKCDGTVLGVGNNSNCQCDVFTWREITAVAAGYYHTVGLKANGEVVASGSNANGQCNVSEWKDIVAIYASPEKTFGRMEDGTILTTGKDRTEGNLITDWKKKLI
jgi:alpha-tubulin suppressor-like RCC1 family protein